MLYLSPQYWQSQQSLNEIIASIAAEELSLSHILKPHRASIDRADTARRAQIRAADDLVMRNKVIDITTSGNCTHDAVRFKWMSKCRGQRKSSGQQHLRFRK